MSLSKHTPACHSRAGLASDSPSTPGASLSAWSPSRCNLPDRSSHVSRHRSLHFSRRRLPLWPLHRPGVLHGSALPSRLCLLPGRSLHVVHFLTFFKSWSRWRLIYSALASQFKSTIYSPFALRSQSPFLRLVFYLYTYHHLRYPLLNYTCFIA